MGSYIVVPLIAREMCLGVMTFVRAPGRRSYIPEDFDSLKEAREGMLAAVTLASADTLLEAFPILPPRTLTVVALVIMAGFPVALGLAWAFDWTEEKVVAAVGRFARKVKRAHAFDPVKGHGFIDSQKRGMEVFREVPPEAPLVVVEAVWQYSHQILHGLDSETAMLSIDEDPIEARFGEHAGDFGGLELDHRAAEGDFAFPEPLLGSVRTHEIQYCNSAGGGIVLFYLLWHTPMGG